MNQQLRDWAKQALEMLNDNHHLVADNEKHRYVMMHLDVIKRGKALLEQPVQGEVVVKSNGHVSPLLTHMMNKRTKAETQPEPVFCEYCGGNDDADFGLPTDHCTDCARPQPAPPDGDKLSPTDAQPSTEDSSEVDHGDELTIAYLDGLHTGKRLVKRKWVGLMDEERLQIMDGNTHFNMLVLAEAKLKEKNT
jgi:hypothetical protein